MPPLAPVPNVVRARVLWQDNTDTNVSNSFFFSYSGGPTSAAGLDTLAGDIASAFAGHAPLWTSDTALEGVSVVDLSSDSAPEGSATDFTPGTDSGSHLAGGTCVLANFRINRRYRGGKPRIYLPWGSASNLASRQTWDPGYTALVDTALAGVISGIVGTAIGAATISNHVNVSYYSGSTGSITGGGTRGKTTPTRRDVPLVDAIVGQSISLTPGSQRRRNR